MMSAVVWDTSEPEASEPKASEPKTPDMGGCGDAPEATPGATHAHAGDQTRARILDVALELIADRGFAATSTREIAERLGVTKAALYYYFRAKDDLLAAIVGPATSELDALIERAGADASSEARDGLLLGYVDLVARHADLIRVLANDPAVKECASLRAVIPLFQRLVPLLAGTDEPDTAQRARVRAALSAIHGALVRGQPADDLEILRATAVEVARAALGLPEPAPLAAPTGR